MRYCCIWTRLHQMLVSSLTAHFFNSNCVSCYTAKFYFFVVSILLVQSKEDTSMGIVGFGATTLSANTND